MRVLFVCTGNTCRSPMAAGLLAKTAADRGLSGQLLCGSAGLSAVEGQPASRGAVLCCRELGVDLGSHRSRPLSRGELPDWDVFFPMTRAHAGVLLAAGVPEEKLYCPGDIGDPFGGDIAVYRSCRDDILRELQIFWDKKIEPALGAKNDDTSHAGAPS